MKIRSIGLAAATAALAISTVAGSVSAAVPTTAKVFVVHGIPGAKVDVCVSGSEVKSNFRYGQTFVLNAVPAGTYVVKLYPASKLKCHGPVVARRTVTLTGGLNATAVARLIGGKPGIQVFVNDTTVPSGKATITVRHTASAPTVDVWLNGGAAPAVPGLAKGASAGPVALDPAVYSWWVSGVGGYKPVIGPGVASLSAGNAYQIYAVGTNVHNYRFVVVGQAGS